MAEAHTPAPPEGGGTDEYRCQVIDPSLTKAQFLTGTQVMPEKSRPLPALEWSDPADVQGRETAYPTDVGTETSRSLPVRTRCALRPPSMGTPEGDG